jgi:hypothetical protein
MNCTVEMDSGALVYMQNFIHTYIYKQREREIL